MVRNNWLCGSSPPEDVCEGDYWVDDNCILSMRYEGAWVRLQHHSHNERTKNARAAVKNIMIDMFERFGVEFGDEFCTADYIERLYTTMIVQEFERGTPRKRR